MSFSADLKQVIYALADALDLVGIDDAAHGKRVAIMAAEVAKTLGWSSRAVEISFDLGLLHDIGVSSTQVHKHLIDEFDWEGSKLHAEVGFQLLNQFQPLAHLALPVLYHHTRWEQLMALGLEKNLAEQANLIWLVDRVDALIVPFFATNQLLMQHQTIRAKISQYSDGFFAPHLVAAFMQASETEAFWLNLEPRGLQQYLLDQQAKIETFQASFPQLKQLAQIFAHIVDTKSVFTAEHSFGVARVARFLAEKMGVSADNCDKIEIAGLLHDLGKLGIADPILEKPGPLSPVERLLMNAHTFETFQILHRINGFEEIAQWAAYHHEEPDGSGYPFHIKQEQMCLEARILRVADIFQAMVQNRPYRPGLNASELLVFLDDLLRQQRVDAEVVAVLKQSLALLISAAKSNS